jgi:hypothetical protein
MCEGDPTIREECERRRHVDCEREPDGEWGGVHAGRRRHHVSR